MIRVLCVGKLKEAALKSLVEEYAQRIQPYRKVIIQELPDEPLSDKPGQAPLAITKESTALLAAIKPTEQVILLDLSGQALRSEAVADLINENQIRGGKPMVFVIGGSLGVSEAVRQRADLRWKLSDNTFPHGLVRVLVLEQIYRAFKILSNQTYHK
jgi:23S rRNA (pseudouridine1915-N3)-methyltransferase